MYCYRDGGWVLISLVLLVLSWLLSKRPSFEKLEQRSVW